MKPFLIAVTLAVAAIPAGTGSQAQTPPAPPENVTPMPPANWLFVQTADSFTFEGTTLTLKGVAPQTLMFTDRPERMTGDAPTAKFVAYWTSGKSDFEKDPPNATLSVNVNGKAQLSVMELLDPRISGDTLTYTVKVIGDAPPASGQAVSLFIDHWYGPGWGPRQFWRFGPWNGPYGPVGPGYYPYAGGCWRGPYGGLHCQPAWAY